MQASTIVDGKKIAEDILVRLESEVPRLRKQGIWPAIGVVVVGNDQPSHVYIRRKHEAAQRIGVAFFRFDYPDTISKKQLIFELLRIQTEHALSGLIVQLPLPKRLARFQHEILEAIQIRLDVDFLTSRSQGLLLQGRHPLLPPTPGAIFHILKYHRVTFKAKSVVLVGRGDLIGKPMASILMNQPVTLTVCGSATKQLSQFTRDADILITGVGQKGLITGDMVKAGVCVIDGGVVFHNGKMYGDVDFPSVAPKVSLITPVPGGVGPITVAKLLENVVLFASTKICAGL